MPPIDALSQLKARQQARAATLQRARALLADRFQFHMIAQGDDTFHMKKVNLEARLKAQILNQYGLLEGCMVDEVNPIQKQWKNVIYTKMCTTRNHVAELRNHNLAEMAEMAEMKRQMKLLYQICQGLAMAPAHQIGGGGTRGRGPAIMDAAPGLPEGQQPANLYSTPRTIQVLWDEYQNGIGGKKPAPKFTAAERGACKFRYSNMKVVWGCMERLLNQGNDVNTAINKIKHAYGKSTVGVNWRILVHSELSFCTEQAKQDTEIREGEKMIDETKQTMVSASLSTRTSRKRRHRLPLDCPFPFYLTLWVWLVGMNDCWNRNRWVQAQPYNDDFDCFDDIYLSDGNGDGRVDAQEYVDFFRLRLDQRRSDEGSFYDGSKFETFKDVPFALQSNFFTLACLCFRFQFEDSKTNNDEDNDNDKSTCCVGDNAHIAVVTAGSAVGVEEAMADQEIMYSNLVCDFTSRAIDTVLGTLETTPPLPTVSPTDSPTTAAPTSGPTTSPTDTPTSQPPSTNPTSKPSNSPTILPTPATSFLSTSFSSPSDTIGEYFSTYLTVKSVYSILVQDNDETGQQQQLRTIEASQDAKEPERKNSIDENLISAMNHVVWRVIFDIQYNGRIPTPTVLHDKLFSVPPTAIDSRVDVGFTSTPKLIKMDQGSLSTDIASLVDDAFTSTPKSTKMGQGSESDDSLETVFVGGPCPTEMTTSQPGSTNGHDADSKGANSSHLYRCQEVIASIRLEVRTEVNDTDTNIGSAETIGDLFSDALELAILNGHLAQMFRAQASDSKVTIATGRIVPSKPTNRVWLLVGSVAAGLFLIMVIVQFTLWAARRDRRLKGRNSLGNKQDPGTYANSNAEQDEPETSHRLSPGKTVDSDQENDLEVGQSKLKQPTTDVTGVAVTTSAMQSADDCDDDTLRMINSVPYLPASPRSIASSSTDDARSTGGISQESDAGWSETYTSSMGSLSEDDALSLPELSSHKPTTLMSHTTEPIAFASTDPTPVDHSHEAPSTATGESSVAQNNVILSVAAEVAELPPTPSSSKAPETILLLEETLSYDDNDFIIHEDSSDEDGGADVGDGSDNIESGQDDVSRGKQQLSPEEFRSKVYALIERVVPDEIDQIDDMIGQFKNREDELIETLLALEKRASSQKKNDQ
eukprot:jgi/Psemu1/62444/estExt_Genemark1.C_20149